MSTKHRPADDFKAWRDEFLSQHDDVRAEYDKLGPRFAAISALIRARERRGLTQAALAERMGVKPSVVSRLESGDHSPRIDTLAAAARALDCELDVRFVTRTSRSLGTGHAARTLDRRLAASTKPVQRTRGVAGDLSSRRNT